ncbi:SdpA family antimicrobial peptide system protein [Myxococcus sp. AB056]|uniref:SdpA family antimicrobial peptide system protein n=1 Tax=Myxococcus sp. AB056 TaxID=2562792 RepID=UPI001E336CBF|nr:SdpA family antimicrobial peptide system protein [Myxococcus sp. AB056]
MTASSHSPRTSSPRRLGLLALGLILGWASVTMYAVHASLPYNPIHLPFEKHFDMKLILPEGWAFFTRDPREDRTLPYLRTPEGQWVWASNAPNFQLQNAFGINRVSRAQSVELGILTNDAAALEQVACNEAPSTCLERAPVAKTLRNKSPRPTMCGELGLVFQRTIPWAWSRTHQDKPITLPSKVLRLNVEC